MGRFLVGTVGWVVAVGLAGQLAVAGEPAGATAVDEAVPTTAAKRSMTGDFVWTNGDQTGSLTADFTAAGEATWTVAFHFVFRGDAHTYTGVASGKIGEGPLSGEVLTENKKRTFRFRGEFKDGVFHGTHAGVDGGEEQPTGTLVLKG